MKAQQLERSERSEPSTADSNNTIDRIPGSLDSPRTKLVYLYLATRESGTVEEVRDGLGIELISLYPVLNTLTSKDLVRKDGSRYVCSNA